MESKFHRGKVVKLNHSFHKYVNYVPGIGEFEDVQDRNGPCPPENNSLEGMQTQKWAITVRGLVRAPSLPYRALVLLLSPETTPGSLPVPTPHYLPVQE